MRVLVTGGAGFVGANLCVGLAERHADWDLIALDNLKRRGAELNLPRLARAGVRFRHGDVRMLEDLLAVGAVDRIIECSAEPSALAGIDGATDYLVQSNLVGAWNCLELARRTSAAFVFLSSSRVYPYGALNALAVEEAETRFELDHEQVSVGASSLGIAEDLPLAGARTLYGATKLAAELLVAEYVAAYDIAAAINRCGVIAGPWQMGKVDQGVFALWIIYHHFGLPLNYVGWGGTGKQVRDLLHVDDLVDLIDIQVSDIDGWKGATFNVGGGREVSLSLLETTALCRELTGREISIDPDSSDRPGDVRIYLSDCRALFERTRWRPRRDARAILADTHAWVIGHEQEVARALGLAKR